MNASWKPNDYEDRTEDVGAPKVKSAKFQVCLRASFSCYRRAGSPSPAPT